MSELVISGLRAGVEGREILKGIDLTIRSGEVHAVMGPNGSGKSTLIGLLLGQLFADSGDVLIGGHCVLADRRAALRGVGAMYEAPAFYDYLSGRDNLRILSSYSGGCPSKDLAETVDMVGLADRLGDPVGTYSHGMRVRLALAQALLPRPEVLILDEPGDGLDPDGLRELRELLLRLHNEFGLTLFFSTHMLGEAERLCTHVGLLKAGALCHHGPWEGRPHETARDRTPLEELYFRHSTPRGSPPLDG